MIKILDFLDGDKTLRDYIKKLCEAYNWQEMKLKINDMTKHRIKR